MSIIFLSYFIPRPNIDTVLSYLIILHDRLLVQFILKKLNTGGVACVMSVQLQTVLRIHILFDDVT